MWARVLRKSLGWHPRIAQGRCPWDPTFRRRGGNGLPATRALLDIRVVPLWVRAIVPRRLGRGRLYRPRRDGGDKVPALRALGNIGVVALGRRAIIPGGGDRLEIDLRGRREDGWIPIGIQVRVPVRPEGRDDTRPDAAMMPMPAVMPPPSAMPPMPPPGIAWHRTGQEARRAPRAERAP